jgi:hypothetical protein
MTTATKFEFQPDANGELDFRSAVFQALGAASVCWYEEDGKWIFDADRAKEIGEALIEYLVEVIDEPLDT